MTSKNGEIWFFFFFAWLWIENRVVACVPLNILALQTHSQMVHAHSGSLTTWSNFGTGNDSQSAFKNWTVCLRAKREHHGTQSKNGQNTTTAAATLVNKSEIGISTHLNRIWSSTELLCVLYAIEFRNSVFSMRHASYSSLLLYH